MGRIKTRTVKAATRDLYEKEGEKASEDFHENKELVTKNLIVTSKKLRNIVAGYTTRIKKSKK